MTWRGCGRQRLHPSAGPRVSRPEVKSSINATITAGERSPEGAESDNGPFAAGGEVEIVTEPRANGARRDAGQHAALQQEHADTGGGSSRAQRHHEGRRDNSQAHEHRGGETGDRADGDPNADEHQRDEEEDKAEDSHAIKLRAFPRKRNRE